MREKMNELLMDWCAGLLRLQLPPSYGPGLAGGLLCPGCSRIHGRCGDAVYPFLRLARVTGEARYLDAAIRVQDWMEQVNCPDGSWLNETEGQWKGITVFGVIALGEALRRHGAILPAPARARWIGRLRVAAEYLMGHMGMDVGNINYPVTCSAALAVAAKALEEPRYAARARELAHAAQAYFSENNLLFGEGHPQTARTPRGGRPVDLGYNVEESLPGLALYAHLTNDREIFDRVADSYKAHLAFMLPDGAWDNSWGTRNYKWTYWGSRTADGCQLGCLMLAGRDPVFAEAARRNMELLANCTHGGLLHGGPHYRAHGELPCSHHTFCHAKALAAALDFLEETGADGEYPRVTLPRAAAAGVTTFPEIATWLAARGPWRATVTAYDFAYRVHDGHASGGALTMLWHPAVGPVLTAGMSEYQMLEPTNQQRCRGPLCMPLTPRVELESGGKFYRNILDERAEVAVAEPDGEIVFTVRARLVDKEQQGPPGGETPVALKYRLSKEQVVIEAQTDARPAEALAFVLPVISERREAARLSARGQVEIEKPGGRVVVTTNAAAGWQGCGRRRVFSHVPGLEAVPLRLKWNSATDGRLSIHISIAERG